MIDKYINPSYPIGNNVKNDPKTSVFISSSTLNEPLDEEKKITDILELYFYSNQKNMKETNATAKINEKLETAAETK